MIVVSELYVKLWHFPNRLFEGSNYCWFCLILRFLSFFTSWFGLRRFEITLSLISRRNFIFVLQFKFIVMFRCYHVLNLLLSFDFLDKKHLFYHFGYFSKFRLFGFCYYLSILRFCYFVWLLLFIIGFDDWFCPSIVGLGFLFDCLLSIWIQRIDQFEEIILMNVLTVHSRTFGCLSAHCYWTRQSNK